MALQTAALCHPVKAEAQFGFSLDLDVKWLAESGHVFPLSGIQFHYCIGSRLGSEKPELVLLVSPMHLSLSFRALLLVISPTGRNMDQLVSISS